MKTGWVGSGGGLKYFWHLGALQYLVGQERIPFDYFVGTSAGALAAVTVAGLRARHESLRAALEEAQAEVRQINGPRDLIAAPWLPGWRYVKALRGEGMYSLEPLARRLTRLVGPGVIPGCEVTVTDLTNGRLCVWPGSVDGAVASATVPVVSPPVRRDGNVLVDGGVRLFAPLKPAIAAGCDRIVAQVAYPREMPRADPRGGLEILARSLDLMSHEMMLADIAHCELVNAQVAAGAAPDKRLIDLRVVYAGGDLPAATPDRFTSGVVAELLYKGWRDAAKRSSNG